MLKSVSQFWFSMVIMATLFGLLDLFGFTEYDGNLYRDV